MSPVRKKGRGGGGGKMMAPRLPGMVMAPGKGCRGVADKCFGDGDAGTRRNDGVLAVKNSRQERVVGKLPGNVLRGVLTGSNAALPRRGQDGKLEVSACEGGSTLLKSRFCTSNTEREKAPVGAFKAHAGGNRVSSKKKDDKLCVESADKVDALKRNLGKDPLKDFFRRNFQRELGCENLRWSATSLPSDAFNEIAEGEGTALVGKLATEESGSECSTLDPGIIYSDSQAGKDGRRLSRGSTVSLVTINDGVRSEDENGNGERDNISPTSEASCKSTYSFRSIQGTNVRFPSLQKRLNHTQSEAEAFRQLSSRSSKSDSEIRGVEGRDSDADETNRDFLNPSLSNDIQALDGVRGHVNDSSSTPLSAERCQEEGINSLSSALHERLALLEGRVVQIAAELRRTKEMLDINNPSRSQILLHEIQGKISSIEKAMATGFEESLPGEVQQDCISNDRNILGNNDLKTAGSVQGCSELVCCGSISCLVDKHGQNANDELGECGINPSNRVEVAVGMLEDYAASAKSTDRNSVFVTTGSCALAPEQEAYCHKFPLDDSTSTPPKRAKPTPNHEDLEERLFPHRKLLRNRPSFHHTIEENRASLHSEIIENVSALTYDALNGCKRTPDGEHDLIAAEFLTQLKQIPYTLAIDELPVHRSGILSTSNSHELSGSFVNSHGKASHAKNGRYGQLVTSEIDKKPSDLNVSSTMSEPVHGGEMNSDQKTVPVISRQLHSSRVLASVYSTNTHSFGVNSAGSTPVHLECEESLPSNDTLENRENEAPAIDAQCESPAEVDYEDDAIDWILQIGDKVATAGWFVCEGDGILLSHNDGCCSYHDVANMDKKSEYVGPEEVASVTWNDCWLIRAAASDGRSNRYVVAASAGSALDSGFCSWDFYTKGLVAHHYEDQTLCPANSGQNSPGYRLSSRGQTSLSRIPLSDNMHSKRFGNARTIPVEGSSGISCPSDSRNDVSVPLWWYRPCGPLLASASSSCRSVTIYDIRDGDIVMSWDILRPVTDTDFCSPLQWRSRGKLVFAEEEAISVWDVNTLDARCLHYVKLLGKQVSALQIYNADAECSGGVRQRCSSSEHEGVDGICCTRDDVNILDFRLPSGIGLKIPSFGVNIQSVFAGGDMILTGGTRPKTFSKNLNSCGVHQWSIRKAMPICSYNFQDSSAHYMQLAVRQVWGSSDTVMAVNGNGLSIFDGWKETIGGETLRHLEPKEVVGTDDLYNPSFDYSGSHILLISRDRSAMWCYWP